MALITTSPTPSSHFNLLIFLFLLSLSGCFSGETATDTEETIVLKSRHSGVDSLHATGICASPTCKGEDCSTSGCHREGSGNPIIFRISGTVFHSQDLNQPITEPNASAPDKLNPTIEFYTGVGGSGELYSSLEVDVYGNFYDTELLDVAVYPALRYELIDGSIYRVYMPRPIVPTKPGTCNFCHQLVEPPAIAPDINEPKYLRINDPVISSASADDLNYHANGDEGPNCLDIGCHSAGSPNRVFTMAGYVTKKEDGSAYDLGDAFIALFPKECDDQSTYDVEQPNGTTVKVRRHDCQLDVPPENVVPRADRAPKTYVEVNARGHFYTTQAIKWGPTELTDPPIPTYPTLMNLMDNNIQCRNVQHMVSAVPESNAGDCYACHNDTAQAQQPPISISATFQEAENCNPPPPPPEN